MKNSKGIKKEKKLTQLQRIGQLEEIVLIQSQRIRSIDSKLEQLVRVLTVKKEKEGK
jgi:hypothetical protein